jgi:hypothetical protein
MTKIFSDDLTLGFEALRLVLFKWDFVDRWPNTTTSAALLVSGSFL